MRKSGGTKYNVYNWTLPALKAKTGLVVCPMAGECAKGCYAQSGAYLWGPVSKAHHRNLDLALSDEFIPSAIKELSRLAKNTKKRKMQLVLRIHDSGDFYNNVYWKKWRAIMGTCPDVLFYAYTKMVPMFQRVEIPGNFTVIFSEGGKADARIKSTDRHSRVFPDLESLEAAGYANAMDDDIVAMGLNHKIGLVYHGAKSRKWSTGTWIINQARYLPSSLRLLHIPW